MNLEYYKQEGPGVFDVKLVPHLSKMRANYDSMSAKTIFAIVVTAEEVSTRPEISDVMREFTQERSHSNVASVTNHLLGRKV